MKPTVLYRLRAGLETVVRHERVRIAAKVFVWGMFWQFALLTLAVLVFGLAGRGELALKTIYLYYPAVMMVQAFDPYKHNVPWLIAFIAVYIIGMTLYSIVAAILVAGISRRR